MGKKTFLFAMFFCLFVNPASGQTHTPEEKSCESPFYSYAEVSQKAKITRLPSYGRTTEEYRKSSLRKGRATISVVLCKDGSVTNIQVIKGLPFGMTERLVDAVRKVEFTPAKRDGKPVSQIQIFEFFITLF